GDVLAVLLVDRGQRLLVMDVVERERALPVGADVARAGPEPERKDHSGSGRCPVARAQLACPLGLSGSMPRRYPPRLAETPDPPTWQSPHAARWPALREEHPAPA